MYFLPGINQLLFFIGLVLFAGMLVVMSVQLRKNNKNT
jgi:uncharacterized membrane protein YgdD (TMEM256/DUF423 family)